MRRNLCLVTSLICLALVALPVAAVAGRAVSAPPERPNASFDAGAALTAERDLHLRLTSERAASALDRPIVIRMSKRGLARLETYVEGERPIRVGAKRRVALGLDFSRDAQPFGSVEVQRDGGFVWTGVVRSPEASALRLELADFDLPAGHELYVYSAEGQVRGPYTGRGPSGDGSFWTHTIFGSEIVLQLRSPAQEEPAARFTVRRAGHMGPKFRLAASAGGANRGFEASAFCGFNASCVENVNCGNQAGSEVALARDAVAQILFPSQGGFFICSGGLLADTDTSTVRELFLTANHCISRASEAAGSESFFQFEVACGASCVSFGSFPSVAGATILKTGKKADYTLMELGGSAPAGSAYLGWNSADVANANGTQLFRISHPGGAPQAYSEQTVDTSAVTCGGWPRGQRIYSRDTYGATEGGSSGSPVVNGAGEVVGQLSGACGFNLGDVCDAESNATVDGAFANYFSQVQDILDPGSTGGGACTPGPAPKGASCSVDSDCQSCKCKGPSGGKTCK